MHGGLEVEPVVLAADARRRPDVAPCCPRFRARCWSAALCVCHDRTSLPAREPSGPFPLWTALLSWWPASLTTTSATDLGQVPGLNGPGLVPAKPKATAPKPDFDSDIRDADTNHFWSPKGVRRRRHRLRAPHKARQRGCLASVPSAPSCTPVVCPACSADEAAAARRDGVEIGRLLTNTGATSSPDHAAARAACRSWTRCPR